LISLAAGAFTPSTLAKIRAHPAVAYVEHDQYVTVSDPTTSDGSFPAPEVVAEAASSFGLPPRTNASDASVLTQSSAPWGLARISHRPALSLSTFTKYAYSSHALDDIKGGVDVYVIDTGINIAHVEFEGRARWGKTIPTGAKNYDGNGHGSHCAGTIGSRKYGVHKGANLVAVKVLGDNGSGTLADVISGIQ
jgi:cerevisin